MFTSLTTLLVKVLKIVVVFGVSPAWGQPVGGLIPRTSPPQSPRSCTHTRRCAFESRLVPLVQLAEGRSGNWGGGNDGEGASKGGLDAVGEPTEGGPTGGSTGIAGGQVLDSHRPVRAPDGWAFTDEGRGKWGYVSRWGLQEERAGGGSLGAAPLYRYAPLY
jgi:hypothetical protein